MKRTLSRPDIELIAAMSGDVNPTHLDEEFAANDAFRKVIAHRMWSGALISGVLGTALSGPDRRRSVRVSMARIVPAVC